MSSSDYLRVVDKTMLEALRGLQKAVLGKFNGGDGKCKEMIFKRKKRIFLDYASSTPVAREVVKAMGSYIDGNFANPSALYSEALVAKEAVQNARAQVAHILSAQKDEIVFTSGGTESNNLALLGVFDHFRGLEFPASSAVKHPHIITTAIEHPAILEVCAEIQRREGEVTILPVSSEGLVSPSDVKNALKENTVLVSVMYANNEIGTIQPIRDIVKAIADFRIKNKTALPYIHTDACQAVLYEPMNVLKLGVDLLTLDGIKMHGPRGMGILYVRNGVKISPIHFGGGQERGLRSGTENVAGIVGFAEALRLAEEMREKESARLTVLREYAITKISETFPTAKLNGSQENRLPNNINICFPGLDSEFAVISLDVLGISAAYSSSCRTLAENSSSYVVTALGRPECAESSLRFTLGRETTKGDLDALLTALKKVIQ